jgi:hypothetical protein
LGGRSGRLILSEQKIKIGVNIIGKRQSLVYSYQKSPALPDIKRGGEAIIKNRSEDERSKAKGGSG